MTGATSIVDNAGLIKRVLVPREVVPIAAVLSNCVHLLIQIALLLVLTVAFGTAPEPLLAVAAGDLGALCGLRVRPGAGIERDQRIYPRHSLCGGIIYHGLVLAGSDFLFLFDYSSQNTKIFINLIPWPRWSWRCGIS